MGKSSGGLPHPLRTTAALIKEGGSPPPMFMWLQYLPSLFCCQGYCHGSRRGWGRRGLRREKTGLLPLSLCLRAPHPAPRGLLPELSVGSAPATHTGMGTPAPPPVIMGHQEVCASPPQSTSRKPPFSPFSPHRGWSKDLSLDQSSPPGPGHCQEGDRASPRGQSSRGPRRASQQNRASYHVPCALPEASLAAGTCAHGWAQAKAAGGGSSLYTRQTGAGDSIPPSGGPLRGTHSVLSPRSPRGTEPVSPTRQ